MAELTPEDVEVFTGGRVDGGDERVQGMLDAALLSARRYVGWHVSPVLTEMVVLDGPDSRVLYLPTRKVVELTTVSEFGNTLPLSTLTWSGGGPPAAIERPVAVRKRSQAYWAADYQCIEVTMEHGYTETEAADWRWAILTMVDQMALQLMSSATTGGFTTSGVLTSKKVDDVTYSWAPMGYAAVAQEVLYSTESVLCGYKLPKVELF